MVNHSNSQPSQQRYLASPPARPVSAGFPSSSVQPVPRQRLRRRRRRPAKAVLAGGSVLALAALIISPTQRQAQQTQSETCTQVIQDTARLSRGELKQLLSLPQDSSRAAVADLLQEPYCLLSATTESGLERQAYPLEFDIDTWFVVEYAGDRYVGYDFSFRK